MPTLPPSNRVPGDTGHSTDTNLIIEGINTLQSQVDNLPAGAQGPQGDPGTPGAAGANASVTVGNTTTGAAGTDAAVTNSGTVQSAIFNFTVPVGNTGTTGSTGNTGPIGPPGIQGVPGDPGPAANISDLTPEPLGTPAPGTGTGASRSDHVHLLPTPATLGAIATSARGALSGVASLDSGGKVPTSELPAIAITNTFVVATQAAMLALTAQVGDVAVRTDVNANFILATEPATTLGNWVQLLVPADSVTSVDGRTGTVTLSDLYDAAGAAAVVAGALTTHEADTTAVHGIANTADLVLTADARLSDERVPTDGSVTTAKIATSAVTTLKINDGAVTTLKITDANVTNVKLANDSITINGSPVALGGSVSISGLPSQSGNSGKYLSTDGAAASWETVTTDPIPSIFMLGGM
jgi:hypothetical protein